MTALSRTMVVLGKNLSKKRERKDDMKRKSITAIVLIILLFCAAGGAAACFVLDAPVIEFDRAAYGDVVTEYGESVAYHEIKAVYRSRVFHREGVPLSVSFEPIPAHAAPGEYPVRYSASYGKLTAEGSYLVHVVDTVPPVLSVDTETYAYTCTDNVDGDLTAAVEARDDGVHVTLTVADSSGNAAETSFTRDVVPPVFTLGDRLTDYTCTDETDGDLTDKVRYYESGGTMYYEVSDRHGNKAETSRKITGGERVIYLTFDDGPGECTEQLLDVLKKYDVRATFFVVGSSEYLDLLPRMAAEGHSIGAHAYHHNYREVYASEEAYFADLARVEQAIAEKTGAETKLIRFPGGGSNTVSRSYSRGLMTKLTREVAERGYTYFDWNVSSGDAGATTRTDEVIKNVKDGVLKQNVAVVLQHDVKDYSVAGVEEILRWGKANGFVFLPLTERSTAPHHGLNN